MGVSFYYYFISCYSWCNEDLVSKIVGFFQIFQKFQERFPGGMISDFCSNYFKISVGYLSKYNISVSVSIPISEIHQNMFNFSEFRQENKPISVFRPFRNPSLSF